MHWLLLFCCICAYIAPKWHAVRTTRAQRPQSDALRAVLVIAVGGECLPAAAFIYINTMSAIQLSLLRTPYACVQYAPGWVSVDRRLGEFQSLPEAVRRCNRRASVGSNRFCHKQKIGKGFFVALFGERE